MQQEQEDATTKKAVRPSDSTRTSGERRRKRGVAEGRTITRRKRK
jgi:hypothetical protein